MRFSKSKSWMTLFPKGVHTTLITGCLMALCNTAQAQSTKLAGDSLKVAVIFDDSMGMCGYLSPDRSAGLGKQLQVLQLQIETAPNVDAQGFYLTNSIAGSAAKMIESVAQQSAQKCPFRAATSPLHTFFVNRKYDGFDVVIMFTDMIFDEGSKQGLTSGRTRFVDGAMAWADARSLDANRFYQSGFGIVATSAPFSGTYYRGTKNQLQSEEIKNLNTPKRPLYAVWRTNGRQQGAEFVKRWIQAVKPSAAKPEPKAEDRGLAKRGETESFVFFPSVSSLDGISSRTRPRFTAEHSLVEAKLGNGSSTTPTYEFYPEQTKFAPGQIEPGLCFQWAKQTVLIDEACTFGGNSTSGAKRFFSLSSESIKFSHQWLTVDETPSLQRQFVATGQRGKEASGLYLSYCVTDSNNPAASCDGQDSRLRRQLPKLKLPDKAAYVLASVKVDSPLVVDPRIKNVTLSWREQFVASGSDNDQRTAKFWSSAWSSEQEPCDGGASTGDARPANCVETSAMTVGLSTLVQSLVGKLNVDARGAHVLNSSPELEPLTALSIQFVKQPILSR